MTWFLYFGDPDFPLNKAVKRVIRPTPTEPDQYVIITTGRVRCNEQTRKIARMYVAISNRDKRGFSTAIEG